MAEQAVLVKPANMQGDAEMERTKKETWGHNVPWKSLPAVRSHPVLSCPARVLLPVPKCSFYSYKNFNLHSLRLSKALTPVLCQMLTLPVRKWEYLLCGENVYII